MSRIDMGGPPDAGATVTFIQHHATALEAGLYRLTLAQEVLLDGTGVHETFVNEAQFAVAGERFALAPNDIDSVYPPDGGTGQYVNVLPHIVIARRSLPWERTPLPKGEDDPHGDGIAPWLALLAFDAADPAPAPTPGRVADLVSPALRASGRLPADRVSYGLAHLAPGESDDDPCLFIDVPVDLFRAIAPTLEDLRWLAHARATEPSARATAGSDAPEPATDYAVVVANRLPTMGSDTVVHLVSLEGCAALLPQPSGGPGSGVPTVARFVRLATLKSWRFGTLREQQGFSACFERIDAAPLRLPGGDGPGNGVDADGIVAAALDLGYVPLDHDPRFGGSLVSWYRGPLAPCALPRTVRLPIASADAITAYDPATGMFDVSYAVAWQLGRLLALADRSFAAALQRWKITTRRDVIEAAELALLTERLGDADAVDDPRLSALAVLGESLEAAIATPPAGVAPPPLAAAAPAAPAAPLPRRVSSTAPPPAAVVDKLGRLRLLEGVPFAHLVAEEAMLPPESIRFVQLDPNWVDCLVDGAYSLGRFTAGDLAHDDSHGGHVHGGGATAAAPGGQAISGFLLRSKAIGWWPGMRFEAFDAAGERLHRLRGEKLASDIVLCLFDGTLGSVVFSEATEALHFGLDMPADATLDVSRFFKRLRRLTDAARGGGEVPAPFRTGGVVRVADLAAAIRRAAAADVFTTAEFALEMVEGVGRVSFDIAEGPAR